jgi:hypothetical protein
MSLLLTVRSRSTISTVERRVRICVEIGREMLATVTPYPFALMASSIGLKPAPESQSNMRAFVDIGECKSTSIEFSAFSEQPDTVIAVESSSGMDISLAHVKELLAMAAPRFRILLHSYGGEETINGRAENFGKSRSVNNLGDLGCRCR